MLEMRMPFKEMLRFLFTQDVHPPFYYILLKTWLSVFGNNVYIARCFSYAGLLACAFGGGYMVKRLYGEKAGLWYTALFLFLPVSFWFIKTIRMYSWACFFCTAAFLSAQSALMKNERKDYVLYVVFSFSGAWTHYYASLTCAIIALTFSGLSWKKGKGAFKSFFIANTVLFLTVCPQIYILFHMNLFDTYWITENDYRNALKIWFEPAVMVVLWTMGIQAVLIRNSDKAPLTALFIAVSVWGFLFILSVFYRPVLFLRYLTIVLGPLYVFFVSGILSDRRNKIIAAVLILLFAIFSCNLDKSFSKKSLQPQYINVIKQNVRPDDVLIVFSWRIRLLLYYWLPDYDIRSLTFNGIVHFLEKNQITLNEIAELSNVKNVFTTHNLNDYFNTSVIFSGGDSYLIEDFFLGKISNPK